MRYTQQNLKKGNNLQKTKNMDERRHWFVSEKPLWMTGQQNMSVKNNC